MYNFNLIRSLFYNYTPGSKLLPFRHLKFYRGWGFSKTRFLILRKFQCDVREYVFLIHAHKEPSRKQK